MLVLVLKFLKDQRNEALPASNTRIAGNIHEVSGLTYRYV